MLTFETSKMTQQVKVFATNSVDLSSVPRIHMVEADN